MWGSYAITPLYITVRNRIVILEIMTIRMFTTKKREAELMQRSGGRGAKIGLRDKFNRRPAIFPGLINKVAAFFNGIFHRGLIVFAAGTAMKNANGK